MEDEEENLAELLALRKEVSPGGVIRYYNSKNQVHRMHGPAVSYSTGSQHWYQNGVRHRLDGPAVIYNGGAEYWFRDGERYNPTNE